MRCGLVRLVTVTCVHKLVTFILILATVFNMPYSKQLHVLVNGFHFVPNSSFGICCQADQGLYIVFSASSWWCQAQVGSPTWDMMIHTTAYGTSKVKSLFCQESLWLKCLMDVRHLTLTTFATSRLREICLKCRTNLSSIILRQASDQHLFWLNAYMWGQCRLLMKNDDK